MYLHGVTVLPSRYEQRGIEGADLAAYDIPFAIVAVFLLVFASRMAVSQDRPLGFFVKAYVFQAFLIAGMLLQYTVMWSGGHEGKPSATFILTYTFLCKVQDLLFFVFEVGEFAFYDRVAMLQPALKSTLIALQTSAFNFSEFLHTWLAPNLVDLGSSCAHNDDTGLLACEFDAYPWVGSLLSLAALLFLALSWQKVHRYQDVQDPGWTPQPATSMNKIFASLLLLGMGSFAALQL